MKSITPRFRKYDAKRRLSSLFGVLLIAVSIFALTFEVFALGNESAGGNTDDGANGRKCTSGNCYNVKKNGAFWVEIPLNGETKTFAQAFAGAASYDTNGTVFSGCPTSAYVLVSRLANGGLAGPIDINQVSTGSGNPGEGGAPTKIGDGDGGWLPSGASFHTNSEAESKFAENQDFYNAPPYNQKFYGTNMGWFCADPQETPPPPSTTTTPKIYEGCKATRTREIGNTVTRIAVRNRTLDTPVDYNSNWNPKSGRRKDLSHDSGSSDGGASVMTIAKPGDSIQFLHSFCAGARYVRRTAHQSVEWTGSESHNVRFDIPTNHFEIKANHDYFLFGDGISWVNEKSANITAYGSPDGNPPYPNDPPSSISNGTWVTTDRFGVGVTSPTNNNTSYDCNGVSMYAAYGVGYNGGGSFQIPGFDSGWSCNSASKTRSNLVGAQGIIQQSHTFNSVKAWEQWTHQRSGSCGCYSGGTAVLHGNYFASEYGSNGEWGKRHTWKCHGACYHCCDWQCDDGYDKYGHCLGGSNHGTDWPEYSTNHEMSYQSKSKDYGNQTKTATVYVPYNFVTNTTSHLNAGDTIFQGSAISSSFGWAVLPRGNSNLSNFAYATVTPPGTQVRFVEFLYAPGDREVGGNQMSSSDPCSYYTNRGGIKCVTIDDRSGNQNEEGFYAGKSKSAGYTRVVPDDSEYIGYKYCVAMGFYPSDSHDYQNDQSISREYNGGFGGALDGGQYWNISGASCRTIAKKPNFQVWNGSAYTEGGIATSITRKVPGISKGANYDANANYIFGSWADYSIIANGDVKGMSSGAVIGYDNGSYNLSGGGRKISGMNMNRLSPLTIANENQNKAGKSNVNASSAIDINLTRLKTRYSDKARTLSAKEAGKTSDKDASKGNSSVRIYTADTGMQFAYVDNAKSGAVKLSDLANNIQWYSNRPNQTTHKSILGAVFGNGLYKDIGDGVNDNTLVISVTGTFVIDGNICLGNSCMVTGGDVLTGMRLNDYKNSTLIFFNKNEKAGAKLPQILIFAKDIIINDNVTRVDAWLIAPEGTINTCNGYSVSNLVARDAYGRYDGYGGNCFKTLMVNGPIYAKSLELMRTAGATHGLAPGSSDLLSRKYGADGTFIGQPDGDLGSQTPGEIFNLRADAYIWAYNQAQRYSEAVVTYMRELAPRY
ncbi:hypothetical protein J6X90_00100 [Candidatus Saccharibacteria bacterium]|nr:hypothetical protein [Candidatus Saccharibacteria bacterium]